MQKKHLSLALAVILIVLGIFPSPYVYNTYAAGDPGFRITDMFLSVNGVPLSDLPALSGPFTDSDVVSFRFDWEIDDAAVITEGNNTLVINLPTVFPADAVATGPMNDSDINYGTYTLLNRVLTFTLNPDTYASDVSGGAQFNLTFRFENIPVDEPYTIQVPISDTVTKSYKVIVSPNASAPAVKKSGQALSASTLQWVVDANLNLDIAGNIIINDQLDNRLIFDPTSVEVYPLSVKVDGTYQVSGPKINPVADPVPYVVNFTASEDATPHSLTISIPPIADDPIPNAYRIVYLTQVNPDKIDFSQSSFTFNNTAAIGSASSTATIGVATESILNKMALGNQSGTTNPSELSWKLEVNKPGYPLKSVRLEDVIPTGLDFNPASDLTVLDADNVDITAALNASSKITYDAVTRNLVIDFGDLTEPRTIHIKTTLNEDKIKALTTNDANNFHSVSFANTAKLFQTQNGTENETQKSSTLTARVGKIIHKTGTASIGYNQDKYINWKLYVNLASIDTGINTVEDLLDTRQTLPINPADIIIKQVTVNSNGSLTEGADLTNGVDYTLAYDAEFPTQKFRVTFTNNITAPYVVTFRSTIDVEDYNQTQFRNTGTIGDNTYQSTVNATISNTFTKQSIDIDSDGKVFDYLTKTYDWRITVTPRREAIQELEIIDTLSDGLFMTAVQFNQLIIRKKWADDTVTTLVKDTDYTIQSTITTGKIKGFVIKFKDDTTGPINHIVNNGIYTIDFKTTIDPDVLSSGGNLNYSNKAEFNWLGNGLLPPVTTVPNVPNGASLRQFNGNKSGTLDLANKQIKWEINLNYLSKDLTGLRIDDILPIDANGSGLKLTPGSIKIYTDTVDTAGVLKTVDITELSEIALTNAGIVITESPVDNAFAVVFNGSMNKPYRIVYTTDMVGISRTSYPNTAITNKGESYSATVTHSQGLTFIDKAGARAGALIDWTITVNQGKSTIQNLEIVDQLTEGLLLDESSFELTQNGTPLVFSDHFDIVVAPRTLDSEAQSFRLIAKGVVDQTLSIKYKTLIQPEYVVSNSLSNTADIAGQHIVSGVRSKTSSITISIAESNGWAVGQLGIVELEKVDEKDQPLAGATFDFYKGASKIGRLTTDANGIIRVEKLKFATYFFREVVAPSGYKLLVADQSIVVNANDTFKLKVANERLPNVIVPVPDPAPVPQPTTSAPTTESTTELPVTSVEPPVQGTTESTPEPNTESTIELPVTSVEPPVQGTTESTPEPNTESTIELPVTSDEPPVQGTTESTPENTPIDGVILVPEGSIPTIKMPPSNGTVTIDEEGRWTYTPDPGFKGRDRFEVILTDPFGNEELIYVDIDIEEVPLSPVLPETLPQTGQVPLDWMVVLGLTLVAIGILLRSRL